jgi:hypothetical protein
MDDRDLVFKRRDGMYVADFSDWLVEDEDRVAEIHRDLCLYTVEERESLYSRKQVRNALEAGEYLRALGYPSLKDAVNIVRDGNIRNVPYGVEDVRRFYDIYGGQVASLRGKTTKRHHSIATMEDRAAKQQITRQMLAADVMHVCGERFLVSVSSPLEVLMVKGVTNLSVQALGTGVQSHVNTLRSRGFEPERIFVDPHKSLVALQGAFPGIEIDPCGAGDHLDKVDTRIRRLKELMRSVMADLPYTLPRQLLKDLVTYGVSRLNNRSTSALMDSTSPRVRLTGFVPDFKQEFGLAFGDYAEVYDPKSAQRSNDVTMPRTEPCVALYPSANQNGSWVFYNLNTKSYVRRTQWKKLPTNKLVIAVMNELAGTTGLKIVDIELPERDTESERMSLDPPDTHLPTTTLPEMTDEEEIIQFDDDVEMPELIPRQADDDSVSESSNDFEDEDEKERWEAELEAQEREEEVLQTDSSGSSTPRDEDRRIPLRRTARSNAGVQRYDTNYEWNLMNLSVGAAVRNFGNTALDACKNELVQLFVEKKALVPVKWNDLSDTQRKKIVRSHMFLREKYEDGKFIKMKGRIVADGRMQDRTIYTDYSSPTAKTRSVMTLLKLAAVQGWNLMKVDVGGAFLCASIDDEEEVFMQLDESLASMAKDWVPGVEEFIRDDGKLVVRVDKAMYGLIQSAKLWYKELTKFLKGNGFQVCPSDECVLVKRVADAEPITVILYVDDILILAKSDEDRVWVKDILERKYGKITVTQGNRLPYLGMTIVKNKEGYMVSMTSYIEDTLNLYGKKVREYVNPTKANLFEVEKGEPIIGKAKFHSMVAKLLYLGKRGRPDILLPVQYLCTRVKGPTMEDERKLERVLGYLQLTKTWTRVFDKSPIERVRTYIDASFAIHPDGKSQSGCTVFLGNTLVHETCKKQKIITRNSTEAELVALSDHIQEGELIEEFLLDMSKLCDIEVLDDVHLVYQDNKPTITIVKSGGGKARTKYMKVREEYVRERLKTKELEIEHVPTTDMIADVLTKPLSGEGYHNLVRLLLGRRKFQTSYASNRGAKSTMARTASQATESLARQMNALNCSHQHETGKRKK